MANNCPNCGASDPTVSITINNSDSRHYTGKGISEEDVTFDVQFPGNDDLTSVTICQDCKDSKDYLTDEYVEEEL